MFSFLFSLLLSAAVVIAGGSLVAAVSYSFITGVVFTLPQHLRKQHFDLRSSETLLHGMCLVTSL